MTVVICQNRRMANLDRKKWFDRMQPQTLQIATWLLYLNGFFSLVSLFDKTGYLGYMRYRFGFGYLLGLVIVALHASGGFMMANDRKLGYRLAVAAAAAPFLVRLVAVRDVATNNFANVSLLDHLIARPLGGSTISVIFDAALVVLLLHRQSRDHQRVWYH